LNLGGEKLRLLLFSELYPKASNEAAGTFITQRLVVLRNTGVDYKCVVLEFRDTLWLKIARKVLRNRESYSGRPVSIDQKAVYPYSLYEYHCLKKGVSDLTFKHVWEKRLLKFLKSIIEEKPDLIHAHWVYPNGFLAVKLGEILHIPVVVTAHGSDIHTNPHKNKRILNQTIFSLEMRIK
jgi:glycosyltransferase involved in cell wall biosynthesis